MVATDFKFKNSNQKPVTSVPYVILGVSGRTHSNVKDHNRTIRIILSNMGYTLLILLYLLCCVAADTVYNLNDLKKVDHGWTGRLDLIQVCSVPDKIKMTTNLNREITNLAQT